MMKKKLFLLLLCVVLALLPALSLASYWRVDTTWLKAHTGPGYKARVLDSYRRDWVAEILDEFDGGWVLVNFLPTDQVVYVQSGFLAKASKAYTAWIASDGTQVRLGPAKSFNSRGYLNRGALLKMIRRVRIISLISSIRE